MARKKIALTFWHSEYWIAGSYYVANIIKAFKSLDDKKKPHLIILANSNDGIELLKKTDYPYIRFLNPDINDTINKYLRKISIRVFKKDMLLRMRLRNTDYIFEGNDRYDFIKNHYYWVHDFQELRMPEFFSKEEADKRSSAPARISRLENATLILSSYDALNDFNNFFPNHLCKVKVLRFASSLPDFSHIDFAEKQKLFDINSPFFICSNQFWQHKNHRLVLEAIKILKEKGKNFQVIFTGKNYDYRNPGYFASLQEFVSNEGLQSCVRFLGFIDREVQLCLAKNSISYIQPSLFEGWSTTVEDAKCLNQFVILSDIPVHKEQLNYNVAFFNPYQAADLAGKMEMVLNKSFAVEKKNYTENIKAFGQDLLDAFS